MSIDFNQLISQVGASVAIIIVLFIIFGPYLLRFWLNRNLQRELGDQRKDLEALSHEYHIEVERLRNLSERELFVYRLQFEKEFEIYLALWEKVVSLWRAATGLRPVFDQVDPNEAEEERKRKRLGALFQAYDEFVDIVYNYRPFYAEPVYQAANKLLQVSNKEAIGYGFGMNDREKYWVEAREHASEIVKLSEELCLIIRQRIWRDLGFSQSVNGSSN